MMQSTTMPVQMAPFPVSAWTMTRMIDVSIALVALMFFGPMMLLIGTAIMLTDRGPILFAHRRIGRGGQSFDCFKFRSMVVDAETRLADLLATDPVAREEWRRDHKLRRDPRITAIGLFLRRSSFDELPQLFNVLNGTMSIVGPRPIVDSEVVRYGRHFVRYCSVRPGITGLWQVSGRNDVTYRRRVALDVVYARSRCVGLDLRILCLTVPMVVLSRGSY